MNSKMYVARSTKWASVTGGAPVDPSAPPPPPDFPNATNTGVPFGTTLVRVPEDVTSGAGWTWDSANGLVKITTANTVFSGYRVQDGGIVRVLANGVTVKNSKIVSAGTGNMGVRIEHVSNITIQNCEISGTRATGGPDSTGNNRLQFAIKDVYSDATNITVSGCNIYDTANSINILGGSIIGNYIHDMGYIDADHIDCIIAESAQGLTISANTLLNSQNQTACVALYSQQGASGHVTVDSNLMAGAGYCIYGGNDPFDGTFIVLTNNKISVRYFTNGGSFGVLAHFNDGNSGNLWSGNRWYDGPNVGAVIPG